MHGMNANLFILHIPKDTFLLGAAYLIYDCYIRSRYVIGLHHANCGNFQQEFQRHAVTQGYVTIARY